MAKPTDHCSVTADENKISIIIIQAANTNSLIKLIMQMFCILNSVYKNFISFSSNTTIVTLNTHFDFATSSLATTLTFWVFWIRLL